MQIDPSKVQWDAPQAIPLDQVKWDTEPTITDKVLKAVGNIAAGLTRGAGSGGATAVDAARSLGDSVTEATPANMRPSVTAGNAESPRGAELRAGMDAGLKELGADPNSALYGAGKLTAEVAGSAGVGGAIAKAAGAAGAAPALVNAIRTGGLSGGGNALTRLVGGAVSGAASAGLVDPADAGAGAVLGAVVPSGVKVVGNALAKIGAQHDAQLAERTRQFVANAPRNQTIQESIDAGYLIPPTSVNPSIGNRILESVSGKQATQQIVSTKNNETTGRLVREALGIPADTPLSTGTLENLRKTAGKVYAEVSSLSPQAAADLEALKTARNEAQGWFKAYNRSARPDDLAKAKEARALSDQLEQALEGHAQAAGKPELIPGLRDARAQIAKTYTVGRALNDASGTVDARVLGRLYEKGAPLTNELETVARFGSAFPTAAKTPQQIGSPAVHNLNALASLVLGGGGALATGPVGLTAAALPFVTAPAARAMLLRRGAQQRLVPAAPLANRLVEMALAMNDPTTLEMFAKTAPVLAASSGR